MPSVSKQLTYRGYLRKNHKGQPYSVRNTRRLFRVGGFHVEYFDDSGKRLGCFDLRNVAEVRPSAEHVGAGSSGIDFVLSMGGDESRGLTVSFADAMSTVSDRPLWRGGGPIGVRTADRFPRRRLRTGSDCFAPQLPRRAGVRPGGGWAGGERGWLGARARRGGGVLVDGCAGAGG